MSYKIVDCCHICMYSISNSLSDSILICARKGAEMENEEVSYFGSCEKFEEDNFNE
ncbi:hypothetical protein [Fusobacterium ulcerans]|uniref:hypothetical protein n=1 Tax=Fusobacterium ulcerans TaxID=861 RepID=UPI0026DB93C4|nr:hypothetical protein [Fusobacterium ulcerans]